MAALEQFGFGSLGITLDDLSAENRVIQLGVEPHRMDLMTSISGVSFRKRGDRAFQERLTASR